MKLMDNMKSLLRGAWVVETAGLILVGVIILFVFPERTDKFSALFAPLSNLIILQGGVAFSGGHLKRLTQSVLHKAQTPQTPPADQGTGK